jgi:hypothetical protein
MLSKVRIVSFALGLGIVASISTGLVLRARAAGIPDANALTYTGYLETPNGEPVTSNVKVALRAWNAETDGTELCNVAESDIKPEAGRFQIPLPGACTNAVKANPNVWLEVVAAGASLGRTKLGAVPYAVEAAHATNADVTSFGAVDSAGKPVKVCTGSTPPGKTKWEPYANAPNCNILATVDTSGCGFTSTPTVVSSLGGNNMHWRVLGGSNVYKASAKNFTVYLWNDADAAGCVKGPDADSWQWHIQWVAVGR